MSQGDHNCPRVWGGVWGPGALGPKIGLRKGISPVFFYISHPACKVPVKAIDLQISIYCMI